jgi:hypothetical protein
MFFITQLSHGFYVQEHSVDDACIVNIETSTLGKGGRLKAPKVSEYSLRKSRRTQASQRRLFPFEEAL